MHTLGVLVSNKPGVLTRIAALLEMLSPHGIQELVQSGQVALGRGARTLADHKSK